MTRLERFDDENFSTKAFKKDYFAEVANNRGLERKIVKEILFQTTADMLTFVIIYKYFIVQHEFVIHTRRKKFTEQMALELISEVDDIPISEINILKIEQLERWSFYNG